MTYFNQAIMTFGKVNNTQTSGDYIKNKTAQNTFCNTNKCYITKKLSSQNDLLLYNNARNLQYFSNNINKTSLNINLITKLNLNNVIILKEDVSPFNSPAKINKSNTNYIYDPIGSLFGNSFCKLNNYTQYMQKI